MKQPMTAAEGAAEERRLWMRKVKERIKWLKADSKAKGSGDCIMCTDFLSTLLEYGEGRTKRNHAKQGGL